MNEKLIAHIVRTKEVSNQLLQKSAEIINRYGSFQIYTDKGIVEGIEEGFYWNTCFDKLAKLRQEKEISKDQFIILLTGKTNVENWFSACNPACTKEFFVTTTDWNNFIYADELYPITYQIIENLLEFYIHKQDPSYHWTHEQPIGCINDMCSWKQDIQFKIKTGDICRDCLSQFELLVGKNIIKDSIGILNEIRTKVISTSTYFIPPNYEGKLHTPIALTKRKISTSSDSLRKTLFAIDHFDLLIKLIVIYTTSLVLNKEARNLFFKENELVSLASLGDWVSTISKLKQLKGANLIINPVVDISKKIKDIVRHAEKDKIVRLRNERGHGYTNCYDAEYTKIFQKINTTLNLVEKRFEDMFYEYILIRSISCSKQDENKYILRYNELMGSNLLFKEKEIILRENPDLIDNHIYLVTSDFKKISSLYPHVIFDNCPECEHLRLMVKDGELYIDIYIGHRIKIKA